MSGTVAIGRGVLGVILGYAAMVILITLVQEGLFGGVSYHRSSLAVLGGAGSMTFLCAVFSGAIALLIAGRPSVWPSFVMSGLVVVETTVLIVTGRVEGPLWFDLLAAGSLIFGLVGGAFLCKRLRYSEAA